MNRLYVCNLEATFSKNVASVVNKLCHIVTSIILPYLLLLIFSALIVQSLHCKTLTKTRGQESQVVNRLSKKITVSFFLKMIINYSFLKLS